MNKDGWITAVIASTMLVAAGMFAQSSLTVTPAGTLASCPAPSAKALIFCNVAGDPAHGDGAYLSANGGAYFQVPQTGSGGVSSFATRTGAVIPVAGDYSYSMLSGQPTKLSCSTATHSGTGTFTASGCALTP